VSVLRGIVRRWRIACACAVLAVVCLPVAEALASDGEEVVARVGGTDVTVRQIRAWLAGVNPEVQASLSRDPNLLNQIARSYLTQQLVLKEALAKAWDQRPEVVARVEQARQSTLVESYLEALSRPLAAYPTDAEVKTAYETSKPALLVPRQYQLAQIYIALPKGSDLATVERIRVRVEGIAGRLKQRDADFAAIAKSESDEKVSGSRGGEIGWLTEMQIQPEIRPGIVNLAKGAVSAPIQLQDGWHILKALDIKESYTPQLEAVRAQIVQQLRAQSAKQSRDAFIERLLKESPVAINELALSKVVPATEAVHRQPAAATPKPKFK